MAAIDFMSLLKEERRKARGATSFSSSTAKRPSEQPTPTSDGSSVEQLGSSSPPPPPSTSLALEPPPSLALKASLDPVRHRCGGALQSVFYLPDVFCAPVIKWIFASLYDPSNEDQWVELRGRRLQCWGGTPPRADASAAPPAFLPEPLPAWGSRLCNALVDARVFSEEQKPNHILVNAYKCGQGILAHTDGPFYDSRTATLSLALPEGDGGSNQGALMKFARRLKSHEIGVKQPKDVQEYALRSNSLLVFEGAAYLDHTHAIDESTVDVPSALLANGEAASVEPGVALLRPSTRVSLTFRHISDR